MTVSGDFVARAGLEYRLPMGVLVALAEAEACRFCFPRALYIQACPSTPPRELLNLADSWYVPAMDDLQKCAAALCEGMTRQELELNYLHAVQELLTTKQRLELAKIAAKWFRAAPEDRVKSHIPGFNPEKIVARFEQQELDT